MRQKRARAGRTYDQVVTECWILRPRAMQVVNCAAGHGQQRRQAVARRDSMAASTPNSHEKQVKNREKRKKLQKIGACGGPWDPISPPHGHPLGPPRRPRGPEAARRSGQSSTAPAGDRPSTITRALLNGLKVLSRAALFRSPGYVAGLRRKRFRSARRRRANFDVRPSGSWTHVGKWPMTRRAAAQNLGRRRSLSRSS